MPNYASEKNSEKIKNQILDVADEYFNYHDNDIDTEVKAYIKSLSDGKNHAYEDYVLDDIKKFDFVDENNPNYALQNEMKQMFNELSDYSKEKGKESNFHRFDYEDWNHNFSENLDKLKDKLDTFNEATDYEYVNNPKMHALKTYLNKLGQLDLSIQNFEYSENINEVDGLADEFNSQIKTVETDAEDYMSFCQDNSIPYDDYENEYSKVFCARNDMKSFSAGYESDAKLIDANIAALEKEQEFSKAALQFTGALLEKRIINDSHNDLSQKLFELNQKSMGIVYDQPTEVSQAFQTLTKLDDFNLNNPLPKNDNDFENYKKVFLDIDPEDKNYDDEEYGNKINAMSKDDFLNYLKQIETEATDTLSKDTTPNKECVGLYQEMKETKNQIHTINNVLTQCDNKIKEKGTNLVETNKKLKVNDNIAEYISDRQETVKKYSPQEAKNQLPKITNALKDPSFEMPLLKDFKEAKNLNQELTDIAKDGRTFLNGKFANLKEAGGKRKTLQEDYRNLEFNKDNLKTESLGIDSNAQMKKSFSKDIDRFLTQSDKCRRWGHKDSPEFLAMQNAMKEAKDNLSMDNIKKMKAAADDYLAKKGEGNFFNTKMRQHRKDLAQAISDFADKCADFDKTVTKANEVKQKSNEALNESSKDFIESIKGNYDIEADPKVKEKIELFYSKNEAYDTAKEKAEDGLETKKNKEKAEKEKKQELNNKKTKKISAPKLQERNLESGI